MVLRGYPRLPREATAERSRPRSQPGKGDAMPSTTLITTSQLSRLIGLPQAPAIIDVRTDEDYRADPRLLPGSLRRDHRAVAQWASDYRDRSVAVLCQRGQKLSEGTATWLRHEGISAEVLEGGFEGWKKASELLICTDKVPPRDEKGRTLWVTRSRPKNRPHRLPLADPSLRRSQGHLPLCQRPGGDECRGALQCYAVRYRGRVLEPSRRDLHVRYDDRGVRPANPAPPPPRQDRARR